MNYSQTPLRAYRPWTNFLPLKKGYPYNGVYHYVQIMMSATRVTCVTAAFVASVRIWPGEIAFHAMAWRRSVIIIVLCISYLVRVEISECSI